MEQERKTWPWVLLFLLALGLLLYPTMSDLWNKRTQTRAIVDYEASLEKLDAADYSREFARADAYNTALAALEHPLWQYAQVPGYTEILNTTGTGILGYLTIERLNLELPVYHGISPGVLNGAVGHLEGTSLPVGGPGTHAVLSAHRGLPSAQLFSRLDELEKGDLFQLRILDRTLTYRVDQIRIVEPEDTSEIAIVDEEDYCTLLTCTPYGVNSHRLLVRGTRVEGPEAALEIPNEAYELDPMLTFPWIQAFLLLLWILLRLTLSHRRRRRNLASRRIRENFAVSSSRTRPKA